jgi:phosphoserine aminotransferase
MESGMRVFNFSAGPGMLPMEVLQQAREELPDWQASGMSVLEVSHRGKAFVSAAEGAEALLRELLAVPKDYQVLFMQGGATGQFSAVPLNLAADTAAVDYVNTGAWSKKAIGEAQRLCARVNVVADESASHHTSVPVAATLRGTPGAAYLHYTPNETIGGVEFPYVPETGPVPLVADMSSTILSRPIDVARFGLIYAGAQKNIGPAGLVVVIVREALTGRARKGTPAVFDYRAMAAEHSMLNTPPTFAWYLAGLVFRWLKAQLLYAEIDRSGFYANPVAKNCRSWMNVPFTLRVPELDATFLSQARAAGLVNLEGHRSVGGVRASIYNAMPPEGVRALVAFMQEFERRHG